MKQLIIEAGHIYTNEQPGAVHSTGAHIGSQVANLFDKMPGVETTNWLFVDNYNAQFEEKPDVLDIPAYIAMLQQCGFTTHHVAYEADLAGQAQEIVAHLQKNDLAGLHPSGKIVLYKNKIQLFDPAQEKYYCALLDACLYLQKLEQAAGAVTILPEEYQAQQKATATILKKLGKDTQLLFPFYFPTPEGVKHFSVDPINIFAGQMDKSAPLGFVQPALDLLKLHFQLSGGVGLEALL